jgi:hypothetical protein
MELAEAGLASFLLGRRPHSEAQRRTIGNVEFLIEKTRLLDRVRGTLNVRQRKVLLWMLREGPDGLVEA